MNMLSAAEAGVHVELVTPADLQAGSPASHIIRLSDALTGAPLTDLIASHERLLHLIIIRRDLQHFQHLHPLPTGQPGEFLADVSFPRSGAYLFFIEFSRKTGKHILHQETIVIGNEPVRSRRWLKITPRKPVARCGSALREILPKPARK